MVVELQHSTFKNLKVFITGTSSGIGHAVSKAYLERGSIVYGIDNNMRQIFFGKKGSTEFNRKRLEKTYY